MTGASRIPANQRVVMPNHWDGDGATDTVKFTSTGASTPRTATWALPVTSIQTYDVYARWPTNHTHAINAPYTVHYVWGTTTVTKNKVQ